MAVIMVFSVVIVFRLMNPSVRGISAVEDETRVMSFLRVYSPAIADHTHAFTFGHSIELGALLEVLLAADTLRVAEACLGKGIAITPG